MKTIFSASLGYGALILLLALAQLSALAQTSEATLRSEISRRYDAFHAAILSKNTTQVRSLLTDDFTHIDIQGRVRNRAEAEVMLTNLAIGGREQGVGDIVGVVLHRYELLSLDASPSEVRVRGLEQLMVQHSWGWWFGETELLDTWVRSGGEWMLQRQQQVAFNRGYALPIVGPQTPKPAEIESPGLYAVVKELRGGNPRVLESFWRERQGKGPLIEPIPGDPKHRRVTFLWRGSSERVEVWGGEPADEMELMTRIEGTDLWYRTKRPPSDAYFAYGFHLGVTVTKPSDAKGPEQRFNVSFLKPDLLNPPIDCDWSVLQLPDAPRWPWITPRPGAPRGTLQSKSLVSAKLKEERTFTVYLPPGYENARRRCHLLVAFDGEWCTNMLKAPTVLDNLINARRIPPTVAAFVNHVDKRGRDLDKDIYDPFADFVCQELVPWLERNYRIGRKAREHVINGVSSGGLMAVYAARRYPEVFGLVLSQSGAFARREEWLTAELAKQPRLPLRLYVEVGTFEVARGSSILLANRHLRDVLVAKGYALNYAEFSGGHDPARWRGTLADGLLALIGREEKAVKKPN